MRRFPWIVAFTLWGCPRPLPAPFPSPPLTPLVRIPPGCESALTGDWQHVENSTFRYHFEDDLVDVTGWVYRAFGPWQADGERPDSADGGLSAPVNLPSDLLPRDAGPGRLASAVIHLRRTPKGFSGEAETLHLLASGQECQAAFATQVTACTPSTLTLLSATSTPIGEGCQAPALPQPAVMLEHRLARTDAGAI